MGLYKNHKENALKAQKIAIIAASKRKENIRNEYKKNPNKCIECKQYLDFYKRKNKFCSSSCSASHNNKARGSHSEETKNKISNSLKGSTKHEKTIEKNKKTNRNKYELNPKKCKICNSILTYENRHRKTCSEECRIISCVKIRPYQNGSRKTIWYYNKNENKEVLLESSWELKLAEFLDEHNVIWIRPNHIIWYDKRNIKRYYFPDFYLPFFDLYLDPKNPYCVEKDMEKLDIMKKKVNIMYGDINDIIFNLNNFYISQ